MNHLEATENQIAERYLLGELPAAEAEAFELHYFECPQCAMDVETGEQFIANAKAAYQKGKSPAAELPKRVPLWRQPLFALPMAAAIAFAAIALYQSAVQIPGLRQGLGAARALPAFQLAGASRGEPFRVGVPANAVSFALSFDIPPDAHFRQYRCILSQGGRTIFRVISPSPADGQPITILVPVRGLKPGNQELAVFGIGPDGQEADKILVSPFDFEIIP